jgi:putative NADH-flavin reductase
MIVSRKFRDTRIHRIRSRLRGLVWLALTTLSLTAEHAIAQPLDLVIFGATGKIGSATVDEALARGHRVTAVSRNPEQIAKQHPNLSVVQGDLLDQDSVLALTEGRDVVILSVRGIVGGAKTPENALQYIAAERLLSALRTLGPSAPRLIHVGGAGSLEVGAGVLYADDLPRLFIPKKLEAEIDGQVLALALYRAAPDVNWTYATPPKRFTNGDRTGSYRLGGDRVLEDDRGRSRISRADFAVALIDEAESGAHVGRRFAIAY